MTARTAAQLYIVYMQLLMAADSVTDSCLTAPPCESDHLLLLLVLTPLTPTVHNTYILYIASVTTYYLLLTSRAS